MKKRIAIYCTYDKQGMIDNYIVFCLQELKKLGCCLVVVSNHELKPSIKKNLVIADYIFEREDICFDAGGIADVCNHFLGWETIDKFDEAIFLNDSVFGPFFNLQNVFNKMDQQKELDFWGITKRGISDFDGGDVIYPEHIQLYFYVVRANMLHSASFRTFWSDICKRIMDFRSAITNYEFEFTRYFEKSGFKWDVYIRDDEYDTQNPRLNLSPYHYDIDRLVIQWKCPFLKRKLFTGDFIYSEYSDKSGLRKAFEWLQKNTDYDMNLIWNHILRTYYLHEIIEGLQLYQLVDGELETEVSRSINLDKFAIYYWDEQGNFLGTDKSNGKYAFVYGLARDCELPYSLWKAKKDSIESNLLCGWQGINNIIQSFQREDRLGVLVPPIYTYGKIAYAFINKWNDITKSQKFYKRLSLTVPYHNVLAPIHSIDAFWCRADFLSEEIVTCLREDTSGTMMQVLPLFAQERGFYTKILMSNNYVPTYMENMKKLTTSILQNVIKDCNMSVSQISDEMQKNTLNYFTDTFEKVYIYGAGEASVRAFRVIKNKNRIAGFIVTYCAGNPQTIEGLPVNSIDSLDKIPDNIGVVVTVGITNRTQVERMLKKKGNCNLFFF